MQHLALGLVEPHYVPTGSLFKPALWTVSVLLYELHHSVLASPANSLRVHSIPLPSSPIKMLKSTVPGRTPKGHDLCPIPPARRPIHRNPAAATIRQSNSPPTDPRGRPGQEPARAPPPGVAGEPAHFYLKKRGEAKHNKPAPSAARQPRPTRSPSLWTAAGDGPASPLPADLRQRVALSPARRRALVCARGEGVALPLSPAPSRKRLRLAAEARREGGEADVRALGAPRRPHSPLLPAPAVAAAQKMAAKTQGGIRLSAVSASARGPVAAEGSL